MRFRRTACTVTLMTLLACNAGKDGQDGTNPTPSASDSPRSAQTVDVKPMQPSMHGLQIVLSEISEPGDEGWEPSPTAVATALSAEATTALLARAEPLEGEHGDRQVFAKREDSLPPPRTGETVNVAFPPDDSRPAPTVPTGPLQVSRFSPTGSVPLAPRLTVTFDRPMVAVTSQEVAAETVPVKLSPQPEGDWRWLGTRTLIFEPTVRFPAATDYTVEIPAGTKSANGDALEAAKTWSFDTPPLSFTGMAPQHQQVGLEPVLYLGFDQAIRTSDLLKSIELNGNSRSWPLRLATTEEIAAESGLPTLWSRSEAPKDREMHLIPTAPLPTNTTFTLTMKKGAASAEGPKLSLGDQGYSFDTYAPLVVEESYCHWRNKCPPDSPWAIQFNNTLDPASITLDDLTIEPAVEGLSLVANYQTISIMGDKPGSTTYTVTLPTTVTDQFGQQLGASKPVQFKVGKAEPTFEMPGQPMMVLDPDTTTRVLSVYTRNQPSVRARIYQVEPSDWNRYLLFRQEHDRNTSSRRPPGKLVFDQRLPVDSKTDSRVETPIDLAPHLTDGKGHLIAWISGTKKQNQWDRPEGITWVQSTQLAVDAMFTSTELVAFATDLSTGAAIVDAQVAIVPGVATASSGSDGIARLAVPAASDAPEGSQVLTVRRGDDIAFLPPNAWYWNTHPSWLSYDTPPRLVWYTFDDRGMYRPGETVSMKGFVRTYTPGPMGDIEPAGEGVGSSMSWRAHGPQGNELGSGTTPVSGSGGFHLTLELPETVNLGYAHVVFTAADGTSHNHSFQIQEFRRPEFEVTASLAAGPHVLGTHTTATVSAAYYAGGGLPGAQVSWQAYATQASYTPPNQEGFSFGEFNPWWWGGFGRHSGFTSSTQQVQPSSLVGRTDAAGQHEVDLHFAAMNPARPMTVTLSASVVDVNRQSWSSQATTLVHPSTRYVGLKAVRSFVREGEQLELDAVVTDIDGTRLAGEPLEMVLSRRVGRWHAGRWSEELEDSQTCEIRSAAEPQRCTFDTGKGGTYSLVATVVDPHDRSNTTELRLWVAGGDATPSRAVELERVLLVPDADEYAPGSTATVFVKAPFDDGHAVVSWRRDGLLHEEQLTFEGSTATLNIPITDGHTPNLFVQVELVGRADRVDDAGKPTGKKRPAFASGTIDLPVPPVQRALTVEVQPEHAAVAPGSSTSVVVTVRDARGVPVADAEVVVAVVDESVLALSGYTLADPLGVFYSRRGAGVQDFRMRSYLRLADPTDTTLVAGLLGKDSGVMLGGLAARSNRSAGGDLNRKSGSGAEKEIALGYADEADFAGNIANQQTPMDPSQPIRVRTDFSALALFEPEATTDAEGMVKLKVELPDSLTRYRVMAVAVDHGNQFGKGESSITARNPVMIRPSPPRFLNFGDRFELPFVIQNQTDQAVTVDLAVATHNAAFLGSLDEVGDPYEIGTEQTGRTMTVPANDRVEVRIPAAADMAGIARFQAVISAGDFTDAARFDLPVWTPATSEAFATYGTIDDGAIQQPVTAPGEVWTQFGGLEITTSSTALQALTDAVLYIVGYPFDCSEQLASRVMSIAALRDVLTAFDAEGMPSAEQLEAAVDRDLTLLSKLQNGNGGFGFWRRGSRSWPYLSIHVGHAIARAEDKGFEVPETLQTRNLQYLQQIEQHIPSDYSIEYRRVLIAYSLYVRELQGDADPAKARRLFRDAGLDGLSMEALGWILPTLDGAGHSTEVRQILAFLNNRVTETAAGAHFVTNMDDGARHVLLASDRRTDGVLLDALIRVDRDNDLIPKVVNDLLAHRRKGRWGNTQENAFVLLAMDRYFRTYEAQTPDFVARAWLGENFAGEQTFKGRETKRARIDIPMGLLTEKPSQDLVLAKIGEGRMYYRIGLRYAPKDLDLEPADYGFTVSRQYEAVDDEGDVTRDDGGTWHIKAGARVRVKLSMVAEARRYHVALVDPLPAGFEAINPALAVSPPTPDLLEETGQFWWYSRTWYEHENLRDERVEAFTSLLWPDVHEYTYFARATTPGLFIAPPTKAEEMYSPETFGRSGTDRVVIE